jgi:hypothetical protein
MMLSFNTCQFALLVAASLNAVTSAQDMVNLGNAGNYVILAKTGISTLPSVITGDIGVSPIAAAAMTGFGLTMDSGNAFSTSTQVTGNCYASDYVGGSTSSDLTSAVSDMETAYAAAAAQPTTDLDLNGGAIGGLTLYSGVYTFGSDINVGSDITFTGDANAVFILQTTGNLVFGSGAKVTLQGGAVASNIFWQVAGHVTVGTTTHVEGALLVATKVVFNTLSSLNGRVLSQTAVTLDQATITQV